MCPGHGVSVDGSWMLIVTVGRLSLFSSSVPSCDDYVIWKLCEVFTQIEHLSALLSHSTSARLDQQKDRRGTHSSKRPIALGLLAVRFELVTYFATGRSAVSELSHTQKQNWKKSSYIYIYIYIYISYVYEYIRWSMERVPGLRLVILLCHIVVEKHFFLRGKCWNMGWRGWCLEPVLYSFIRYAY